MSPTAHSLRCSQCHGSFAVDAIRASVTCPYCGYRQTLERHAELAAYERAVQRRVAAADEHNMVAASAEAWIASAASDPKRRLAVAYGLILGVPLLAAAVLVGLHALGLLTQRGPGMALAIGGASYAGVISWLILHFSGRKKVRQKSTRLTQTRVACPSCGAPGLFTPGKGVERCSYCDAALAPTNTMIDAGIDAARAALRTAANERRRAQRLSVVKATNMGAFTFIMPIMIVGPMVLMLGVTCVGFSVEMVRGSEPFHPGIFGLWALTIAVIGSIGVYLSRRRQRRAQLRAVLGDVVSQLGGTVLPGVARRVTWLNDYWGGDYDQQLLVQPTYQSCSAAVGVGHYSALVDVELNASRPAPRVDLLLAAWLPGYSDGSKPSKRLRDRTMSTLGFHVRRTEGGLVARANKPLLDAARRSPDVVHVVVPALARLAQMATERGYTPIAAP